MLASIAAMEAGSVLAVGSSRNSTCGSTTNSAYGGRSCLSIRPAVCSNMKVTSGLIAGCRTGVVRSYLCCKSPSTAHHQPILCSNSDAPIRPFQGDMKATLSIQHPASPPLLRVLHHSLVVWRCFGEIRLLRSSARKFDIRGVSSCSLATANQ